MCELTKKPKEWDKKPIPENEIEIGITEKTIEFAESFGYYLSKTLKTTQLRKFYGEVKRIQMVGYDKGKNDFLLLQPKLAYNVGRLKRNSPGIEDFYNVISNGISRVKSKDSFKNFIKIFEAIVAYHKQYVKE